MDLNVNDINRLGSINTVQVILREDKQTGEPLVVLDAGLTEQSPEHWDDGGIMSHVLTHADGYCMVQRSWIYDHTRPASKPNQAKLLWLLYQCGYNPVNILKRLPKRKWGS